MEELIHQINLLKEDTTITSSLLKETQNAKLNVQDEIQHMKRIQGRYAAQIEELLRYGRGSII